MTYDLIPRYSTQKSFYGKAVVEEMDINGCKLCELYSYGTKVAMYSGTKNHMKYESLGHFTMTTSKHQKEFFRQAGLDEKQTKKVMNGTPLEVGEDDD